MASGVVVSDHAKRIIDEMKVRRTSDIPSERMRLVVFKIDTEIIVDTIYKQKDLEEKDVFAFFMDLLQNEFKETCRYFLYDCHYEKNDSVVREELIYVTWASEKAKCTERMLYCSSKSAMTKAVDGVKHSLHLNDASDLDKNGMIEKLGRGIKTLEGVSCACDVKGH